MTAHSDAIARALRCAQGYRSLGYQPLPSKMDVKGPMLPSFAEFWDRPLPDWHYRADEWKTTNIQLMTGCRWKLMVVDCDGDEAIRVWERMMAHHGGAPETWVSRTGGGGLHFYYAVPDWLDACPSRRLWGVWDTWAGTQESKPGSPMKGDWQKHKEVRVLGDQALVIAPPSIHVETGKPYHFQFGPDRMKAPAPAPGWLLKMPEIKRPECVEKYAPPSFPTEGPRIAPGAFFRREEVLAAIPSPIDVVRSWGVRVASSGPDGKGWWKVHAFDRDDDRASCQFHDRDAVFWDGREKTTLSLFDLGVAMNHFTTWQECRDALGAQFITGKRPSSPPRRRPPARMPG